jgi:propanediol utilization protein
MQKFVLDANPSSSIRRVSCLRWVSSGVMNLAELTVRVACRAIFMPYDDAMYAISCSDVVAVMLVSVTSRLYMQDVSIT